MKRLKATSPMDSIEQECVTVFQIGQLEMAETIYIYICDFDSM